MLGKLPRGQPGPAALDPGLGSPADARLVLDPGARPVAGRSPTADVAAPAIISPAETSADRWKASTEATLAAATSSGGVPAFGLTCGACDLQCPFEALPRRGLRDLKIDGRRSWECEVRCLHREAAIRFGSGRVRHTAQHHGHRGIRHRGIVEQAAEANAHPVAVHDAHRE